MKNMRIIPRLDIKGPNIVKGIHLEGLRVLGKPEDFAYQYYLDGADELIYMDVVASLYRRNSLFELVKSTVDKVFIPLTVGGGIRTIEDIRKMLRAGADKVAINTAAIHNPELITEAAKLFGSQCVVVSIEAKRVGPSRYEAFTDNGRERSGVDVFEWAARAEEIGAGEILLTSVDREGTGKGYDIELVKKVSALVSIPVIACGGAGSREDFYEVIQDGKADAVSAASVFHYLQTKTIVEEGKFREVGNIEYLKSYSKMEELLRTSNCDLLHIWDVKELLISRGIPCRPLSEVRIA